MNRTIQLFCKVCKKPITVDLPEEAKDCPPNNFDYYAKSVTCDPCLEKLGYARRRQRELPIKQPSDPVPPLARPPYNDD